MSSKRLNIQQRKEIFLALVQMQDQGNNVRQSLETIAEQFSITEAQLKQIQEEGIEAEWPPLAEAVS